MPNILWKKKTDEEDITKLKEKLNILISKGVIKKSPIDEIGYGPQTRTAVIALQRFLNKQKITDHQNKTLVVDGLYGRRTDFALQRFLKTSQTQTGKLKATPKIVIAQPNPSERIPKVVIPSPLISRPIKLRTPEPSGSRIRISTASFEFWHPPVLDAVVPNGACHFGASRPSYTTESGARVPGHKHHGLDIFPKTRSNSVAIFSALEGDVFSLTETNGSGGNAVNIRTYVEGIPYFVEYMHLKERSFKVKSGQTVNSGDAIASMGKTGLSSTAKSHLHISARKEISEQEYSRLRTSGSRYITKREHLIFNGEILSQQEYKTLSQEQKAQVTKETRYFLYVDPLQFLRNGSEQYAKTYGKSPISL